MDRILCYVVRHGETALNASGRYRGRCDVTLSERGKQQAQELANFFSNKTFYPQVVMSDLLRVKQTFDIINETMAYQLSELPNCSLRSLNVGDLSGQPQTKETRNYIKQRVDDPSLKFDGGESLLDFRSRVRPVIHAQINRSKSVSAPVLILAHSSIVHEVGVMFENHHSAVLVKPGGVTIIYLDDSGKVRAKPMLKPDTERIESRADFVS